MISHVLDEQKRILYVKPTGPLKVEDFENLAKEVDPFITKTGGLRGLVIEGDSFEGWENLLGFIAHFKFIHEHHTKIEKVAAVTDGVIKSMLPSLASHFVKAEIKHFKSTQMKAAEDWILSAENKK